MNRVRDTIARMLKAGSEGPEYGVIYGITDHEYAIGQIVHHHALLYLHRCRLFRPDRDHSPAVRPELSRRPGSYYGKGVYGNKIVSEAAAAKAGERLRKRLGIARGVAGAKLLQEGITSGKGRSLIVSDPETMKLNWRNFRSMRSGVIMFNAGAVAGIEFRPSEVRPAPWVVFYTDPCVRMAEYLQVQGDSRYTVVR